MEEPDRISELPDEALHQILSSLTPRQAIQTSILSKRWNSLWSSLPFLRFSHTLFTSVNFSIGMIRFERFVTRFLSHRENTSAVRELKLSTGESKTASGFIENCIDYVINHGIERLHIEAVCPNRPFNFPDGFSACRTLRALRLKQSYRYREYSGSVVLPKPFVLPTLKTLYLERFRFNDDRYSFPKEPFSGFLDLEELTLFSCDVSGMIISAQKLKFLEISFDYTMFSPETNIESMSAPTLTSFRHEGPISLVCQKIDFPCLDEVYIEICALNPGYYSRHSDGMDEKMPENLFRLLHQLKNARFVTLTFDTIELLAQVFVMDHYHQIMELSPSPFPDIKCLNIKRDTYQMKEPLSWTVVNYLTKESSYGDSLMAKYFPEGINEEECYLKQWQ